MPDLYGERLDYTGDHLLESNAPSDPFALFDVWLAGLDRWFRLGKPNFHPSPSPQ